MKSTWHRVTYKAYSIIDIFSRKIVGYRVEAREVDDLAVEMFETAIAQFGAPDHVHADSGAAMKSNALKNALEAHGVCLSHNRPYVSNDNPYSESEFRTMKYRPDYPGTFESLETARAISMGTSSGTTRSTGIPGSRSSPRTRSMTGPGKRYTLIGLGRWMRITRRIRNVSTHHHVWLRRPAWSVSTTRLRKSEVTNSLVKQHE